MKLLKKIIAFGIFFLLGASFIRYGIYEDLRNLFQHLYFQSTTISNHVKPESLSILIDNDNFEKISLIRNEAIKNGIHIPKKEDYVKAKFIFNGDTINGQLRLKGARNDHWNDNKKWSYRIKLDDKNSFLGLNKFSIQHPKTRFYLNEWFTLKAIQKENILCVNYEFIQVNINGKNYGVYAMEEHFNKNLIEKNGYRDGPILRFKGNYRRVRHIQIERLNVSNLELGSFSTSPIEGYNIKKKNKTLFKKAYSLLASFREGALKTSEVFDVKKLATYLALKDLLGSSEMDHNDLRFYYNPITSKLEPIGFDMHSINLPIGSLISSIMSGHSHKYRSKEEAYPTITSLLFDDHFFAEEYVRELNRISKKEYLNNLTTSLEEEINVQQKILQEEYLDKSFLAISLDQNRQFIRSLLNAEKHIQANYVSKTDSTIRIEVANIQSLPIHVIGLKSTRKTFNLDSSFYLKGKSISNQLKFYDISTPFPSTEIKKKNISVLYQISGLNKIYSLPIGKFEHIKESYVVNDITLSPPNYLNFNFISEQNDSIIVNKGTHLINETLIIPTEKTLVIRDNTTIDLANNSKIISYSPIFIENSTITSSDNTGQGIAVINANDHNQKSYLKNVKFNYLQNPSHNRWELPASITFYQSDIVIDNCHFTDNIGGDDYINIFRSTFEISNCSFTNIVSDAIDIDFSNGIINNCNLSNCGNDAIDASGSKITINNIEAVNIEDKVISAGESSELSCKNIHIANIEIAFASKDNSMLAVDHSTIDQCNVLYAVFQKKINYGGATILANHVTSKSVKTPYLVEINSSLIIDNEKINSNYSNIKEILLGTK